MQFFTLTKVVMLLATLANVAQAVPAEARQDEAQSALEAGQGEKAADLIVGWVATGINGAGVKGNLNVGKIPSGCRVFLKPWNDGITSIFVKKGIRCNFYTDGKCESKNYVTVRNGAVAPNLSGTNFNDAISSVSCFKI